MAESDAVPGPAGVVSGNAESVQKEEARRDPRPQPKGGFFQRKYGPLPGWGWALLAGGGALAYFWWRSRKAAQAASTASSASGSASSGIQGEIDALQQEINAFYGQGSGTSGSGSGGPGPGGGRTTSPTTGTSPSGTGTGAPSAPSNLHHVRVGAWAARIGWTASTGQVQYYEVQSPKQGTFQTTATTVSLINLRPRTDYQYAVRAVGPGGKSAWTTGHVTTAARGNARIPGQPLPAP